MTTAEVYSVVIGLAGLLIVAITQASRAIFRTGKLIQMMEDMKEDIDELKSDIKVVRERELNALRGSERRGRLRGGE